MANKQIAITKTDMPAVTKTSCFAATLACSLSCRPMYWEARIAPPVASAEKILMSSTLMESTSDTPATAASPQLVTITVSAIPMATAKNCSTISGQISRASCFLLNIAACVPSEILLLTRF